MTFKEKRMLVMVHAALNEQLGDTDVGEDLSDADLRIEEPLLWAAKKIAELIGPGPWDKYVWNLS